MIILIVEDEGIVALDIARKLEGQGFSICGVATSGSEALVMATEKKPDLILMDITLKGDIDGIQTATLINKICTIPVIFLTALSDRETWKRAAQTLPAAYIVKPFQEDDLQRAIELALLRASRQAVNRSVTDDQKLLFPLKDRMFIRSGNGQFLRVLHDELLYLEAERAYCSIITRERKFLLPVSLNNVLNQMNGTGIVRVHKSFAVNLHNVDRIEDQMLVIGEAIIPVAQQYKTLIQKCIRLLK